MEDETMKTPRLTINTLMPAMLALMLLWLPVAALAHGPMMGDDDDTGYGMMAPGTGHGMGMMGGGLGYGQGYGMGQGMGYGMGCGMGMMGPGYGLPVSNLTDAQREKIARLQRDMRQDQYQRMGDMMEAMEAMHAEMRKAEPDPEAVAKAYDKVSAVRREMLKARVRAHNELRGVLTDEQREQLRGMGGMMW
jgi:Spy/CpxP family protein refolding chaperone